MGVHGLWQLLQPAGRPVSLESLEGKVLAVDVSIWLHQTMKGMRDKDGNPLPNAHLQGLFSRVCKLLFYRIKPVFVFDGGVPVLKKQTMAARRERKTEAERESNDIAQKLLRNLVRSQAVKQALGDAEKTPVRIPGVRKGNNKQEQDIFELTPLPEADEMGLALNAEEWERDFEQQENWIKEGLAALSDTHPDSNEFRSLPMEIQHEILNEMREQKKYHSLSRLTKMPEDSDDFSSYQLKKLMKQSKLTNRIEEVRKEMTNKTSGDITYSLGDDYYGDEVEARRIVSEDASHYVLIKGLTKRKQLEEAEKYEIQKLVKIEKEEEGDEEYGGGGTSVHPAGRSNIKEEAVNAPSTGKSLNVSISSDSDDDVGTVMARRFRRKKGQKRKRPSVSGKGSKKREEKSVSSKKTKIISSDEEDLPANEKIIVENNPVVDATPAASESSSEDEGFIEVNIDPTAAMEEDELFPASIFQTNVELDAVEMISSHSDSEDKTSDRLQTQNSDLAEKEKYDVVLKDAGSKQNSEILTSHPGPDDASANRKNVLNDILSQLQEKKKSLQESVIDMDVEMDALQAETDTSMGGGFIPEEEEDEDVHVESKNEILSTSDKTPDTVSQPMYSSGFEATQNSGRVNDNPGKFSQALAVSDEEDDDLKLAIELSLQSAKSEQQISDESGKDFSQGKSQSAGLEKHREDFVETKLSKPQNSQLEIQRQSSNLDVEDDSFQIHGETTKNKKAETSLEYHDNKGNDNTSGPSRSESLLEDNADQTKVSPVKLPVDRPQPEDFEVDEDLDTYFQTFNEDDLEDMNFELQSERQTLLSERGRQTRMATSVTEQTNLEAQELLRLFGIPYIVSPMEAEAQCAYLDITDQTQGTITDDSDIWLFGGRRMYKNFFNQNKHVEFFSYDSIHKHFGLERKQLINIALLCGSDYTEGIQGVGPVRALEIMAEFPGEGLEGLYMFRQWWDKAQKTLTSAPGNKVRARLKDLNVIRGFPSEAVVEAYMNPTVDDSSERFSWGSPDLDMLREFAKQRFGWPKDKTDKSLLPMMKQINKKQSQGRIHSYFQPENFVQVSKIKSDRLKKALEMVKNPRQAGQENEEENDIVDEDEMAARDELGERARSQSKGRKKGGKAKGKVTFQENEDSEKSVGSRKPEKKTKITAKAGGKVSDSTTSGQKKRQVMEKKQKVSKEAETSEKVVSDVQEEDEKNPKVEMDNENDMEQGMDDIISEDQLEERYSTKTQADGISNRNEDHSEDKEGYMQDAAERTNQSSCRSEGKIGKGKVGGAKKGRDTVGGRGRMLVSLDQKVKPRKGQGSKGKRGGSHVGVRGAVNLSESSSSGSDDSETDDEVASSVSTGSFSKGQIKQFHGKKTSSKSVSNNQSNSRAVSTSAKSKSSEQKVARVKKQDISEKQSKRNEYKELKMDGTETGKSDTNILPIKQKSLNKKKVDDAVEITHKSMTSSVTAHTGFKIDSSRTGRKNSESVMSVPLEQSRESTRNNSTIEAKAVKSKNESKTVVQNTVKISPFSSATLAASAQADTSNPPEDSKGEGVEEFDMRKADVSVINKRNLPATLAYLNRRSREDTFLLHQLKGSKVKNAVEQRLEASERRRKMEKEKVEAQGQSAKDSEEILSFEDMLGGIDQVVSQQAHKKTSKKSTKPQMKSTDNKDDQRVSQAKKMSEKIKTKKQTKSLSAPLLGEGGKEKMQIGSPKQSSKSPLSAKSLPSKGTDETVRHKKPKELPVGKVSKVDRLSKATGREESEKPLRKLKKVGFGSSDESFDWEDVSIVDSMESKDTEKSLKSNRSRAFDKAIGVFGNDDDGDDFKKHSKKISKFQKQMEHLGDSRSVKGHGITSRNVDGGLVAGRAFAGKGKGRGKNRSGRQGLDDEEELLGQGFMKSSTQTTEDELREYTAITADDLGSDFSDIDF